MGLLVDENSNISVEDKIRVLNCSQDFPEVCKIITDSFREEGADLGFQKWSGIYNQAPEKSEFERIALAHPEVFFTIKHNDTDLYNLPSATLNSLPSTVA